MRFVPLLLTLAPALAAAADLTHRWLCARDDKRKAREQEARNLARRVSYNTRNR